VGPFLHIGLNKNAANKLQGGPRIRSFNQAESLEAGGGAPVPVQPCSRTGAGLHRYGSTFLRTHRSTTLIHWIKKSSLPPDSCFVDDVWVLKAGAPVPVQKPIQEVRHQLEIRRPEILHRDRAVVPQRPHHLAKITQLAERHLATKAVA